MGFGREVSWISEHSIEEETTQLTQGSSRRDGWSRQLASLILDGCCATRVEQCSSFLGNLGQKEATWCSLVHTNSPRHCTDAFVSIDSGELTANMQQWASKRHQSMWMAMTHEHQSVSFFTSTPTTLNTDLRCTAAYVEHDFIVTPPSHVAAVRPPNRSAVRQWANDCGYTCV